MRNISDITCHNKETYYYITSNFLNKVAGYGLRTLFVLYLTSEAFHKTEAEALSYFSNVAIVFIICRVLGAMLGDLVFGNKNALLLGGMMQALGYLLICLPNQISLFLSIGFISLGSGLYSSNLSSLFGKLYLAKNKLLDGAFTMFYTSIHFGAFMGILIIGALGVYNFKVAFFISSILILISTYLAYKVNDRAIQVKEQVNYLKYSTRIPMVIFGVLFVSIFWMIYEFAGQSIPDLQMKFSENAFFTSTITSWYSSFSDSFVLIIGLIFSIFWSYNTTKSFSKISIGFLVTALSFALILIMPETNINEGGSKTILAMLLLAIGEIFIAPVINSILTKYSNPKYLAISMSLAKIPTVLFASICAIIPKSIFHNTFLSVEISSIFFLSIGILAYFIFMIYKNEKIKSA